MTKNQTKTPPADGAHSKKAAKTKNSAKTASATSAPKTGNSAGDLARELAVQSPKTAIQGNSSPKTTSQGKEVMKNAAKGIKAAKTSPQPQIGHVEAQKAAVPHRPTESELEILKIIWDQEESTVRSVHEKISLHKNVGYTTTLKLMQIMHDKGILARNTDTRTHIYTPAFSRDKTLKQILGKLIDSIFNGSTFEMLDYVLEHRKLGKKESESLKKHFKSDKKGK